MRRFELGPLSLSLLSAVDTTAGADETLALSPPEERSDGATVVERRSTIWERAWLELHPTEDGLDVHTCVRGRGAVTDVRLLGGRSLIPRAPLGPTLSGTRLPRLFSPNPEDGVPPVRDAGAGATSGVSGDGEPGRGRWLFTPPPLWFALGDGAREWVGVGITAPVTELRFVQAAWQASANGFSLALDFDGHTIVDGELRLPVLRITTGVTDPYEGLRRHRDDVGPPVDERSGPEWWSEPIFCGWGAQCHLEREFGGLARDHATQADYDGFLAHLERHGLEPRTVVLDDKWQSTYGRNEPDRAKWPDLKGWIAEQHARGRHVLLWWKAWDPEGLPPEICIRNADDVPVAVDPAAARGELVRAIESMLSPDGLDADGLKIDFTARTPSGRALSHSGSWGIALLHDLLAVVYAAAKNAKPHALVITHTPHPGFVDVTDMIRLNDMTSGEIVPQMAHRAKVVRAACQELPIDTDDWRVPDKRSWRAFLEEKRAIGVPSLYYASHLDAS